jgi:hypothetical protein
MSKRKKWRLKHYPNFTLHPAPSMREAYARMLDLQVAYADGSSNIHRVDIYVDERTGCGWQLFETCEFPERAE